MGKANRTERQCCPPPSEAVSTTPDFEAGHDSTGKSGERTPLRPFLYPDVSTRGTVESTPLEGQPTESTLVRLNERVVEGSEFVEEAHLLVVGWSSRRYGRELRGYLNVSCVLIKDIMRSPESFRRVTLVPTATTDTEAPICLLSGMHGSDRGV